VNELISLGVGLKDGVAHGRGLWYDAFPVIALSCVLLARTLVRGLCPCSCGVCLVLCLARILP
jgi:hypothetical protein